MSQVTVTTRTMHFGTAHEKAAILCFANDLRIKWGIERRPASTAFEFRVLVKKRLTTAPTNESTGFFGKVIMAASAFGPVFAHYFERFWRKSFFPFRVGFDYFFHRCHLSFGCVVLDVGRTGTIAKMAPALETS